MGDAKQLLSQNAPGAACIHLVAKWAGAVVGAGDITNTSAVVLTGDCQTGGALGHQIQISGT